VSPTIQAAYRAEVGWFDKGLGELLEYMDGRDLLDRTVVLVTGLHGTVLDERPARGAGLSDELLRVPLLIRSADADESSGRRVVDLVRHVDIAPTLAQLAGAPEGAGWQGTSLVREYALRGPLERLALAESHRDGVLASAVRDGSWKLVDGGVGGSTELYYLVDDPQERNDLSRRPGAEWKLEEKRAQLRAMRERLCQETVGGQGSERELTVEDCGVLRRLGYQEGFSERCRAR